jgi:aminoglycoside phosphotransferase (APT) family kinase protein
MSNFMQRRHEHYSTTQEEIAGLLREATGHELNKIQQIIKGYDSEVYLLITDEGKRTIIRIHRHGDVAFTDEAWAMEQYRAAGVPVPQVLVIDEAELGGEMSEFMILEEVVGNTFADMRTAGISMEMEREIARKMGALLHKAHSITVDGFYRRNADGGWDFGTFKELMVSVLHDRTTEIPLMKQAGLKDGEISRIIDSLNKYREKFDCLHPVLCHGDFLPEHIFVQDEEIEGVIDFGMFEGNDPIHDLAFIYFEAPGLPFDTIIEGYFGDEQIPDGFDLQLRLHALMLAAGHLTHHTKSQMLEEAHHNFQQVKRLLRELEVF